jgi:hypothetical protein
MTISEMVIKAGRIQGSAAGFLMGDGACVVAFRGGGLDGFGSMCDAVPRLAEIGEIIGIRGHPSPGLWLWSAEWDEPSADTWGHLRSTMTMPVDLETMIEILNGKNGWRYA